MGRGGRHRVGDSSSLEVQHPLSLEEEEVEEEEVEEKEEQARRCSTLSGDVAAQWEAAVSLSTSPTFVLYLHLPPVSIVLASLTARHSHSCIVIAVVVAVAEAEVYQHHQHLFCI